MNVMRRVGCIGLVAFVVAVFAGCNEPDTHSKTTKKDTPEKIKIGVSIPAADHGWTAGVGWWAEQAMKEYPNIEWTYSTSQNAAKQVSDIEDMMVKDVDGLVILCTESAAITPIGEKAHEKGIYIVNVDRGFVKKGVADIFIEGDNKAFGRKSAQFAAEKLNGKGNAVILEGIPCTVNTYRVESAKEVLSEYSGITLLGTASTRWDRQSSLEAMEVLLNKHSDIDVVIALDDDVALGAKQAIEEAGREDEMFITGGGGMNDVVEMIMEGEKLVAADFSYPPSMIATGIHLTVIALTRGEKTKKSMPSHLTLDVDVITEGNAERYYFPNSVY